MHVHCGWYSLSRMMTQSRMATRAPVLSPALAVSASALHSFMLPSRSQVHTLMVSVLVLLCMGRSPSEMTTGTWYTLFCRLL